MAIGSILTLAPFSATPSPPPTGFFELYIQGTTIYLQDSSGTTYAFGTTTALSELTGDVSAIGPGSAVATVNFVGGESAANIASATATVLNATAVATPGTLVLRDSSGNFSANIITATLNGNASTATSAVNATNAINFTGGLSGDVTGTQSSTVVSYVDAYTAAQVGASVAQTQSATASNTASTLVLRDASGNFSANIITSALNGNSTTATNATTAVNFTGSLSGDVTGTQSSTSIASTIVTGKILTGLVPGTNTAILSTDSILTALEKLQAQVSGASGTAITSLTGDVSATGPGAASAVVNSVGGQSAANIANATAEVLSATSTDTPNTLVLRDSSGNFSANIITSALNGDVTGNLTGNVTGNVSGSSSSFTGSLSGDVTGTQSATSISSTIVTSKILTGFSVGTNSPIIATDSVLGAFEKVQAQINAIEGSDVTAVTASNPLSSSGGATPNISFLTQTANTFLSGPISGGSASPTFRSIVSGDLPNLSSIYVPQTEVGAANGVASLDSNALVPLSQIPLSLIAPFYAEYHVNPGYTGSVSTGSYNQPYTTIQAAVNAAQTFGAANSTVVLHGTNTTENVVINNYTFNLLIGYFLATDVDNQLFLLNGNVTISGSSTRIRLRDFKIQYPGGTQPDLIDSSQGRNYFNNMGFEGGGGIQYTGNWARWHEFTDCTVSGTVNIAGTPSAGSSISLWRVRGGGNYVLNNSNATLGLYDNFNVGNVTQTAGVLTIDGGRGFVPGSTISSTTNSSSDLMTIINVSLETSGSNFAQINKTGTAPYILSNVFRNEVSDVLTGTRLVQGASAADERYVPTTPANWPVPPTSVLQALDELAASVSTIGGSAITSLTGDVVATGPGAASSAIQANVVTNAKLAQMGANTIKGNNTGATANAADLSVSQVTAMLNPFIGDTGTGGTQGLVPAPAAGTKAAGDFLSANGTWTYVDQSSPIYSPFSTIGITQWTGALNAKFENIQTYTGIDGHKQYAAVVAGGLAGTLFIWDITNPAIPTLCSFVTLSGAYNVSVAQISGGIYAFVPSSGGSTLYTINVTNPYSLTTTSSLAISGSPGSLYSCVYANGYVYIATQNKGLTVVDVGGGLAGGTLTAPIQSYQEGGTTNKSAGIAIFGNFVYTSNYQTTFPATVRYLKTWELAAGGGTLAVPFLASTYTIPGGPTPTSTKPASIALSPSGTTAYVTDGNQGVIDVIDITSPTSPNYLSYITPSYSLVTNTLEEVVVSPTLNGNYLYVPSGANATNGGCIDLFDVTTPASPLKIKSIYTGVPNDIFGGIALNNGYIFGADYGASGSYSGLAVFTQALLSPTFGLPITSNIQVQQLTPNTALVANSSQQLASSTTTATELGYVHGVTSPIQAQINSITGSGITSLSGDVVATGPGAVTATVQPNVITNAKLAQAPANTIKGNNTGSTANEADLTTSQVATMLGSYFDAAGSASTVQTNLNNYINPTSLQFSWLYQNPHYYTQMIYTGSNVTQIIYWDSPSMTTQLFTKNMTYTGSLVTQVVLTRISDGATLTKNIAYSGSQVSTVTRS